MVSVKCTFFSAFNHLENSSGPNFVSKSSLEGEINGKVDGYLEFLFINGIINNDIDVNFFKKN